MSFRVTESARRDLEGIWMFTNREWGVIQADQYLDSLIARFEWLRINKSLWNARDDVSAGLFSYRHDRHVILFRPANEQIEIIRVLHNRMDVRKHV